MRNAHYLIGLFVTLFAVRGSDAGVVEFTDKSAWIDAVGDFTTIGFTGFPDNTPITDQYSALGATFTTFDVTSGPDEFLYPNDSWGLQGFDDIIVTFDEPINWVGVDFPGGIVIELQDELGTTLYESTLFGVGGTGFFGGIFANFSFHRIRLTEPIFNSAVIDDLHFGPPIPAPGALALLVIAGVTSRRRR